jgi:hypothetical protein
VVRTLTRLGGAAAICAAMVAASSGTALAAGPAVTIQISGNAYLQPDGSALLTVTYSCLAGFSNPGEIQATLEQSQGFGAAAAPATCDDQNHTTTLDLQPGPYVRGAAAANVTVTAGLTESGNAQSEVQIR